MHPDRCKDPQATQRFQQLSASAAVLTCPLQRADYDRKQLLAEALEEQKQQAARQNRSLSTVLRERVMRPRNIVFVPFVLLTLAFGTKQSSSSTSTKKSTIAPPDPSDTVLAWYNPQSGVYETPAPWDPLYRKLQPKLVKRPRHHVIDRRP